MVVRRRPSTTRITGAWNVLPAKPKPTSPTLSMTGIVHHALSAATSVGGATAWSRRAGANIIDEPNPPRCDEGASLGRLVERSALRATADRLGRIAARRSGGRAPARERRLSG